MSEIRLGIVRGISYGLFGKPDSFVPQARALGAGLVRSYVYWGQVEPRPGEYTWSAVDALMAQFDGTEEIWLTLCSSSPWATRLATDFLPPSPARDLDAYAEFVRQVVRRCAKRVTYWQCDNEPSNTGLLWAGTAAEYVAQLRVMYDAVKSVDPDAQVVLGGLGYDMLSTPPGSEQRQFFEHLAQAGRDVFDVFDVHLYGDPYCIPEYVDTARQLMSAHGYDKSIVAGEYAGPALFEFPELEAELQQALASAFAAAPATQSTGELAAQAGRDTPERLAMKALYARMGDLPPKLQMFMAGCPPELEAKRHRISCRQIVVRNILALSQGIRRTNYWNLAPEIPGAGDDPYTIMHLLFGKLPLLDYRGTSLECRHPEAETFALLARQLDGARSVTRVELRDEPAVHGYEVQRAARESVCVVWERRDAFGGESAPPRRVSLPWRFSGAHALDVFGAAQSVEVHNGQVRVGVSDTPVFIEA